MFKSLNSLNKFNRKTILSLGLSLFLLLTIIPTVLLTKQAQDVRKKAQESKQLPIKTQGFIIELKNDPAIKHQNNFYKSNLSANAVEMEKDRFKKVIENEHATAKSEIIEKLGLRSDALNINSPLLKEEFTEVFNGFTLNIDQSQADKIKNNPSIKSIHPNYEVKTTLMDSVPLIQADKVWTTKDIQGKNITGEGINIGIIDTGVDYTHPDLGATQIQERQFDKITSDASFVFSLTGPDFVDQSFALNNNRLAYPTDHGISIYNFQTKTTQEIAPYNDNKLWVVKLALKDNILAYYAYGYNLSSAAFYYYNLQSGEHLKIADAANIGSLTITQNKIIYARDAVFGSQALHVYAYDTISKVETQLTTQLANYYLPLASNNLVVYQLTNAGGCNDQMVLYNLNTGTIQQINPPFSGRPVAFKDNKILYAACDIWNIDTSHSTYYLYDIATNESIGLKDPLNINVLSGEISKQRVTGYSVFGWLYKGAIGDNIAYFSRSIYDSRIMAYDMDKKRIVKINLINPSNGLVAENNRVCFASSDKQIYCHIYDPNYSYPLPTNIFNNKVIDGYNFFNNTNDPFDDNGHGTHVSSIAAGNNTLNGVAPQAKIIAYKVLDSSGSGKASSIIAALDKAVQTLSTTQKISVINLSLGIDCKYYFGGYTADCGPDDPVSAAVDNTVDAGINVVVAAGNSGQGGSGTINSPGTARKAITVGSVNKSKIISSFSSLGPVNYNSEIINKPDVVAPGESICAAQYDSFHSNTACTPGHITLNGTSMATPHVAGALALLKQAYPDWTTTQTKNVIKATSTSLSGYDINTQGSGLINVLNARNYNLLTPSPTPTPTSAPIGNWKFDEGTGTVANNSGSMGSPLNGIVINAPFVSGRAQSALSFNGSNSYVTIPNNSTLTPNKLTVMAWIKPSILPQTLGASQIVSKMPWSSNFSWQLNLITKSDNKTYLRGDFSSNGTSYTYSSGTTPIYANNWYHTAMTWDGVNIKFYVNGLSDPCSNVGGYTCSFIGPLFNANTPLEIGRVSGGNYQVFSGVIDEVRFYNSALTGSEIKTIVDSYGTLPTPTPTKTPTPFGYWKLDEGVGSVANDSATTSPHSGTLINSPTWLVNGGRVLNALQFNGSQRVSIPSFPTLPQFTLAAWIKPNSSNLDNMYHAVIAKGGVWIANTNYAFGYRYRMVSYPYEHKLYLYYSQQSGPSGAEFIFNSSPIDTWTHIAVTFDGSTLKGYQNGLPLGSVTKTETPGLNGTNNLTIGGLESLTSTDKNFYGVIDEVKVYNSALTESEIKALVDSYGPLPTPTPISFNSPIPMPSKTPIPSPIPTRTPTPIRLSTPAPLPSKTPTPITCSPTTFCPVNYLCVNGVCVKQ